MNFRELTPVTPKLNVYNLLEEVDGLSRIGFPLSGPILVSCQCACERLYHVCLRNPLVMFAQWRTAGESQISLLGYPPRWVVSMGGCPSFVLRRILSSRPQVNASQQFRVRGEMFSRLPTLWLINLEHQQLTQRLHVGDACLSCAHRRQIVACWFTLRCKGHGMGYIY